jgi:UDP-N-acetyl-D-mannosaminuronic acid dehydrogenase
VKPRKALDVVVLGGAGHVGLPLAIMFAKSGLQVGIYDIDQGRLAIIRNGRMPFMEYGAEEILPDVLGSTLHVLDDLDAVSDARHVIVTIGTPVDEYLNPAFGPILDVVRDLAPRLRPGAHVMFRSTVYPGTTRELGRAFQEAGADVRLSYCPERIVQGHAISELEQLPQIVSGIDEHAVAAAVSLFERLAPHIIVIGVDEAELTKLYLNAWRYIRFAIANQFFMMAEEFGADFFQIHRAMTEGYDRGRDFPLPGLTAGPCLLKDTMQLAAFQRGNFQLGHAAMLVNEGLANFIVDRVRDRHGPLAGLCVGILGMAFKANIDDTRDSLAYKVRKILQFHGADVIASDPYVIDPDFVSTEDLLQRADVVVLGAPHDVYRSLQLSERASLVDVWGFFVKQGVPA